MNLGVVWFTASRRLADTLSYMAETVRTGSFIWDQALFTRLLLLPNSRKFPWSGRHSLRMMDPLVFPNTCKSKRQTSKLFVHVRDCIRMFELSCLPWCCCRQS